MTEPKTVSNLPIEVNVRWVQDQQLLEEIHPIIHDASLASQSARTEVSVPVRQSEFDAFLGLSVLHPSWALFQMPPNFLRQGKQLFRYTLAPCIGSDEQQETVIARIEHAKGDDHDQAVWQQEKESLLQCYQLLQGLNKDLIYILTRLTGTAKG